MTVPRTVTWEAEPHTRVKHAILEGYLGAWYPILIQGGYREIVYLDGFAGPGEYAGGERGSPIVALTTFKNNPRPPRGKIICIFVEKDSARHAHLKKKITEIQLPRGIVPYTFQGRFEEHAERLLADPARYGLGRCPTFAFIDPFGIAGLPLDVVTRVVKPSASEGFITFMIEAIERLIFSPDEKITAHLDSMFGTPAWRGLRELEPEPRRRALHDLYVAQLRKVAGLQYTRSFEMRDEHRNPIYSLIFGTRDEKGLKVMKESMWKADPGGGCIFSDSTDPDQVVFLMDEPDLVLLRKLIVERFRGAQADRDNVFRFVLVESAFLEKHARQVLRTLEDQGTLSVVPGTRKNVRTYPAGTILEFGSDQTRGS